MPQAVAPILIGVATGAAVVQGQRAARQQRRALRAQEQAQQEALNRAQAAERRSRAEFERVNRRQPDATSLLGAEQARERTGAGSTLLTGSLGVDPGKLLLGRKSLLGG